MSDALSQLARLPAAESDPIRAERVQQRCRTALTRETSSRNLRRPSTAGRRTWQAAAAGLSMLYVAEVLLLAARVLGTR